MGRLTSSLLDRREPNETLCHIVCNVQMLNAESRVEGLAFLLFGHSECTLAIAIDDNGKVYMKRFEEMSTVECLHGYHQECVEIGFA